MYVLVSNIKHLANLEIIPGLRYQRTNDFCTVIYIVCYSTLCLLSPLKVHISVYAHTHYSIILSFSSLSLLIFYRSLLTLPSFSPYSANFISYSNPLLPLLFSLSPSHTPFPALHPQLPSSTTFFPLHFPNFYSAAPLIPHPFITLRSTIPFLSFLFQHSSSPDFQLSCVLFLFHPPPSSLHFYFRSSLGQLWTRCRL